MLLFVAFVLILLHQQVQSQIQLSDFNKQFRDAYSQARNHLISTIDPLIIKSDDITLIHRGKRTNVPFQPPLYDDLKAISHIPFTIYLFLFNIQSNNYDLSPNQTIQLKSYLKDISTIRQSLSSILSSENIMRMQYDIIDLSIDYLRSLLESEHVNQTLLKEFCLKARIMFTANLDRAARSQLDFLHSIVYPWYTQLFNETERQTLKILLLGSKSIREGCVSKLYFYELLDEHYEGKRILYAENMFDEPRAITILGSWLLDAYAGDAFYDDSSRLHRDLMENSATVYLKQLFKPTNN